MKVLNVISISNIQLHDPDAKRGFDKWNGWGTDLQILR